MCIIENENVFFSAFKVKYNTPQIYLSKTYIVSLITYQLSRISINVYDTLLRVQISSLDYIFASNVVIVHRRIKALGKYFLCYCF